MDELEEIRKKKLQEIMEKARKTEETLGQPDKPIEVTDTNFHELVNRYTLMVIDCWAAWCAPCRIIEPVIEELALEYRGKIVFGKLNTDENRATSIHYQIMSIPTLLIVKDGKVVDRIVGAVPKPIIKAKLQGYI